MIWYFFKPILAKKVITFLIDQSLMFLLINYDPLKNYKL
jgi:hypothetical protein